MMYYVYMLRCSDDSLYTGITSDLRQRMRKHTGKLKGGAKYTALRPPKAIAAVWTAPDKSTAAKAECAIKQLSAPRKRELIHSPQSIGEILNREDPLMLEVYDCPSLEELIGNESPSK